MHNDCGGSRTAFRLAEPAVLDCCVRKDFDAADHHPGQHGSRFAAIDRVGKGRRVIQTEIDLAAPNRLRQPARRCLDIADIGETQIAVAKYPHGIAVDNAIDRLLTTSTVRPTDLKDAGEEITVVEASTGKFLKT